MIDLHLHLDGSLSPQTVLCLAKQQGIALPADTPNELLPYLMVNPDCSSLAEYLEKFELPLRIMQTREALRYCVYSLLCDLKKKNMVYVEIRFAPQLHTQQGMTQIQACEAAREGLYRGMRETGILAQLILCCMRGADNEKENLETVRVAEQFLGEGVCALDLAGAEAAFKTENFAPVFALAKHKQIPFTIHAGEAAGADSIWAAIHMGAARIGHGVRAYEDSKLLEYLKTHKIPLEMCPVSNVQTQAISSMTVHPILDYLNQGICVTINTDNMTVSGTDLDNEIHNLRTCLGAEASQIYKLLENSVQAAFLDKKQKQMLRERFLEM